MTCSIQRVKLIVLSLLPLIIFLIMIMFLLPLLNVLLDDAQWILNYIMFALIKLCLVLMNPSRIEVLFRCVIILLVMLLA
jgi:hypothetical protein